MALGALKMWREAEEFFEICVSAPAQIPAAIQLEALKKLTLIQLILYGKVSRRLSYIFLSIDRLTTRPQPMALPKYANQALSRLFKQTPYFRLADVFPKPLPELQALITKEGDIITRVGRIPFSFQRHAKVVIFIGPEYGSRPASTRLRTALVD